ncbi:hypothetical protein T4B_7280 [Trichinella pseudospiralis]|uniref:Uncharacterized protein n=1 Tax=Trichinella pseudospiralis TaxID=6337 RepID=A0A0V1H6N3_TRIPS|nr:hypothetical protein T4B_7280 [Trichinella pseudospiralis]
MVWLFYACQQHEFMVYGKSYVSPLLLLLLILQILISVFSFENVRCKCVFFGIRLYTSQVTQSSQCTTSVQFYASVLFSAVVHCYQTEKGRCQIFHSNIGVFPGVVLQQVKRRNVGQCSSEFSYTLKTPATKSRFS